MEIPEIAKSGLTFFVAIGIILVVPFALIVYGVFRIVMGNLFRGVASFAKRDRAVAPSASKPTPLLINR